MVGLMPLLPVRPRGPCPTRAHTQAYIIQSIMASRYIVAQQRRLNVSKSSASGSSMASTPTSASASMSLPIPMQGSQPTPCSSGCSHHCTAGAAPPGSSQPGAPQPGSHGCRHYERKCSLVAPCCGKIYACRLCHDEENEHKMDRSEVSLAHLICPLSCTPRKDETFRRSSLHAAEHARPRPPWNSHLKPHLSDN